MAEITFVAEHDEVYVNLDEGTGAALDVYFRPSSPLAELFQHHAGHNPLFIHADDAPAAFEYLRREYIASGSDLETLEQLIRTNERNPG